jgi:Domain of unknown function (DUF4396)
MVPEWLHIVAIISLVLAGLSMLLILTDILNGHAQKMPIMNIVWPVTALYFGPLALIAYWKMGRPSAKGQRSTPRTRNNRQKREPLFWKTVFVGVTHCGAGCTLGDLIAEWTIFWLGLTLAGLALWPEYILDYLLAYLLGIIFQYFAIAPMRGLSLWPGLWAAIKADTLSLTAFEIGLFAWMALSSLVFFHPSLHPDSPVYWFMMQIGMIIGFGTSYPMNWWLIKKGIKEAM